MLATHLPSAAFAGQAVPGLVLCQRRPSLAVSATGPGSTLASSGTGLLTCGSESSSSSGRRGRRPEPQAEVSGGGGGRGPRRRLGYSGDGGQEEDGSDGLRLPWDRLLGLGAGVQARLEADPAILSRLGRDCCLDLLAVLAVSLARRNRLGGEAELVASRVCMALLCDCALAYMMAPAAHPLLHAQAGSLKRQPAQTPASTFLAVQAAVPPQASLAQRAAWSAAKAVQCGGAGFVMGCVSSGLASATGAARHRSGGKGETRARQQAIAKTGLGWLCYMSLSSQMRYSALHTAEVFLRARLPGPHCRRLFAVLHMGTSCLGAHAWIALEEALGLKGLCAVRQCHAEGGLLA